MRYYMLLECGSSMLIAAKFYMGYFPESDRHPHLRTALLSCTFCPFCLSVSTSNACYLFLHQVLITEHSIVVSIMYRYGIRFVKTLSIPHTQPSSNEFFGLQLTAANSLVLMTRRIHKKGVKNKNKVSVPVATSHRGFGTPHGQRHMNIINSLLFSIADYHFLWRE